MRITLENMRHFKAVADWGSLNLAANKINISPSAVSRSIKMIEEDLGYQVFQRVGRKIVINQDGRRFLEKVNNILSSYQGIYSDSLANEIDGSIKIGASHWLAVNFIPSKLESILREHPQIVFETFSQDSNISVLKVLAGDLDFAICFSPKAHPDINSTELFSGELLLAANKKHPLIEDKNFTRTISEYPAIIHKANEHIVSCIDHPMFHHFNITPKIAHYWDSDLTAIKLMKNKNYWSLMPDIIVKNENGLSSFKHPREWNANYTVKLIWNKKINSANIDTLKKYFL